MLANAFSHSPLHRAGFTLIEIMVVLMLVVVIGGLGYFTLSGALPKMRLKRTAADIQDLLIRAQSEAYSRSQNVGFVLRTEGGDTIAEIFIDTPPLFTINPTPEIPLRSVEFRHGVEILDELCNPFRLTFSCGAGNCQTLFFDNRGQAVVGAANYPGFTQGTPSDYEMIIFTPRLSSLAAREVEVLSSGVVRLIPHGQPGQASPLWKVGGTQANSGATACPP